MPLPVEMNVIDSTTGANRPLETADLAGGGGGGGGGGDASAANQTALNTLTGAVTETAPASDTASSGLNGRLQRVAQRITSLIALVPASLGAKTQALSFATVPATEQVTMQSAAAATGNGTVLPTTGHGVAAVQITGTFVGTVAFEGTIDGTNYVALNATPSNSTTAATTATAPGVWVISVGGLIQIRARVSAYSSGSITVTGRALSVGAGGGGGGGGGGGAVTIADAADVTLGAKADAKSTATDTTAVSAMSVFKQISSSVQTLVSSMIAALGPGEEHIGSVGGNTTSIYINPTIANSSHVANDVLGGKQTLTNWSRVAGLGSRALSMSLRWNEATPPTALDFLFFRTDPSTSTADDAAFTWGTSQVDVGTPFGFHVRVTAAEWTPVVGSGGTVNVCTKLLGVGFVPTTANAYLYVVTPNTFTPAANALYATFKTDRD